MSHKPAKRSKTETPTELAAAAEGWAVLPLHVTDGNKRLMDEYVRKSKAQSKIDFPDASWALNIVALNRACKMAALDDRPLHVKLIGTDSVKGTDECEWVKEHGPRSGCRAAKKEGDHVDHDDPDGVKAVLVRVYSEPAVDRYDNYASSSFLVGHVLCVHCSPTEK